MFTRCLIGWLQLTKRPALRAVRRLRLHLASYASGSVSAALQLNQMALGEPATHFFGGCPREDRDVNLTGTVARAAGHPEGAGAALRCHGATG